MKYLTIKRVISVFVGGISIINLLSNQMVYANEIEQVLIPEPIKVVDFSNSFEELTSQDESFQVVENGAKPILVQDEEMGQVLQLQKAIKGEIEYDTEYESGGDMSDYIVLSDSSEYSTIKLTNPYIGMEYLKEYKPYEDVNTIEYENNTIAVQPDWKEGITISYWIKTPSNESDYGLNSNVIGFTSEGYQMESQDYAKHLCTVKYDIDSSRWTDEIKEEFGITLQGVDRNSDFWFELSSEDLYYGCPIYRDPEDMGKLYWMNKNYVPGYLKMNDGTVKESEKEASYDMYKETPILNSSAKEHNPGNSVIRYGWTYSEMWLDASSSFYYTNASIPCKQLNPNHEKTYDTYISLSSNNSFCINSWNRYKTFDEAFAKKTVSSSPVSIPEQWHYVTVVIQNDWVKYYIDGNEINVLDEYSALGRGDLEFLYSSSLKWFESFNKGTGARYGLGTNKQKPVGTYYGQYVSPTIMEWLIMDSTQMTIGGGNRYGDLYNMNADTDEIMLKNVVFYDVMLSNEQIKYLAENPFIYETGTLGDLNSNEKINAEDALLVLKHSARIEGLNEYQINRADVTSDGSINAEDALEILKFAAGIISEF